MNSLRLRLLPMDRPLLVSMQSASRFQRDTGLPITEDHLAAMREMVVLTLEFAEKIQAEPVWSGYFAIDDTDHFVCGCGGFKGNPDAEGRVELAYFTHPDYENAGYATALAGELVKIARGHAPAVRGVLAHTLPERNASCRVLEKNGFVFVGPVEDPDDGHVWRWLLTW